MINGKAYDWSDVTITLPYGTAIDIRDISYDDELDVGVLYGKGAKATRYGTGNYKAEGKMTVTKEEFEKMLAYAKKQGKALYGLDPFPITVGFANDGEPVTTDELKQCKLNKTGNKSSQGSKEHTVDLSFIIIGGIVRSGVKAI